MLDNDFIIPDVVMHVVLLYYFTFSDEWDSNAMGTDMQISKDAILQKTSDDVYQSAFLKQEIDTGIYKWRFKIIDYNKWNSHYNYLIGIWMIESPDYDIDDLVNDYFSRDYAHMYGYLAACGLKVFANIRSNC